MASAHEEDLQSEIHRSLGDVSIVQSNRKDFHVFEAQKSNARVMYPILKALSFMEYCLMTVTIDGFKITIDDQHHQQANIYFHYDQFSTFVCRSTVKLCFHLNTFTELLNVFAGNTTHLRIHYDGEGSSLIASVEDDGIVFNCAINTQIPNAALDFEFNSVRPLCKVILRPECMRDVIRELDNSALSVMIIVTKSYISFYTDGDLGKIKTEIPSHSEQVELLECLENRVCHSYKISLIRRILGCFAISDKVSIRINEHGVICFQFLIPLTEDQHHFVEIFCTADGDVYFR
uniref:Cell cycle checkpoint protein RAD1 n=1 Tax=Ditylenchus dipsaci TaxID=166011 RepID=A0A915CZG6_9BILA